MGEKGHTNQPPPIPGQCSEHFVTVFFCSVGLFMAARVPSGFSVDLSQ